METRWRVLSVAAGLTVGLLWLSRPAPVRPLSKFPAAFPVRGLDISHHNGAIDWAQVRNAGLQFVWVKATEGGDMVDARFRENVAQARAAGLKVGAYHFFTFCRPGAAQAENFLSMLRASAGVSMVAVDVESVGNCRREVPPQQVRGELERWLALVEAGWGRPAVIYTTPDAAEVFLPGLDRALWVRSMSGEPQLKWSFWQFRPAGQVPGIEGAVDLDVFKGSLSELDGL
jgi:lysozyme